MESKSSPLLSLTGAEVPCTVDLSLMPKLMHAVTAARHLADPPLDAFGDGAFPVLRGYFDSFKRSSIWQRTAAYGDAGVVQFWGDYLVKLGKREGYTKLAAVTTPLNNGDTINADRGSAEVELFGLAKPGEPGVQSACRFCHWVMLHLEARNVSYKATFIDPKDKPAWFLDMNPKGEMPVIRHGAKVIADSKSIVAYLDGTWPVPAIVAPKRSSAVGKLEQAKMTDFLWTLLSADAEEERLAARRSFLDELADIDAVLTAARPPQGGSDVSQKTQARPSLHKGRARYLEGNVGRISRVSDALETKASLHIDLDNNVVEESHAASNRAHASTAVSQTMTVSGSAPTKTALSPAGAYLRRRRERKLKKRENHKTKSASVKRSWWASIKLWRKSRNWYFLLLSASFKDLLCFIVFVYGTSVIFTTLIDGWIGMRSGKGGGIFTFTRICMIFPMISGHTNFLPALRHTRVIFEHISRGNSAVCGHILSNRTCQYRRMATAIEPDDDAI